MKIALIILLFLLILSLWRPGFSFRSQKSAEYTDTSPTFDLTKHLNGELISEGLIYGPNGRVSSRFVAKMNGNWNGREGTLSEDFSYATGNTQKRKWILTIKEDGAFSATADDLIGVGVGQQTGSTVRMTYRIKLPESAGGHELDVIDWMYLMENGTIMNRSEMRKFGVKVAELIATIRPVKK